MNELVYFDEITQSLSQAAHRGKNSLEVIPGLLHMVISEGMWKRRLSSLTGQIVEFETFEQYVTALPPEGLGTTIEVLKCLCCNQAEWIEALDGMVRQQVEVSLPARTQERNPEIRAVAISGNSMVVAKKRRKGQIEIEKTFNPSNVVATANKLKRYMKPEQLQELIENLQKG